ncbi:MAG TPA: hypothetical protein VMB47_08090 [Candidatus Aquilonibacter sp.]|nr:hypothetical protein [Candidatus Aquilonibacter sp.]
MSNADPSSQTASGFVNDRGPASSLRPALIAGLYTGAMLVVVMLGALVVANRVPTLEPYAFERNAASYALFVLIMLLPVLRFLNRPVKMFVASMTGWVLLAVGYDFAGLYFHNLFNVLQRTPFEVLIEGAIVYAVLSVAAWVCAMILHARHHPLARRPRAGAISSHR